jgi:tyrosine-protein phosphatase SIW14
MMGIGRVRLASAAAVLTLALSGSYAGAQTPAPAAGTSATESLSGIRIFNFGKINANYYRGSQPSGQDVAGLAGLGVKTVIDLRNDEDGDAAESKLVEKAGMKYVSIPMTTHEVPSADKLAKFLKLVNDPASQPVYVHCVEGRHRTGVMTAVYRMTGDGWTSTQAFQEMKDYRFGADFLHREFKKFVFAFQPTPAPVVTPPVLATSIVANSSN